MKPIESFDPVWENLHKTYMPPDTWPMDDLIRHVARHFYKVPERQLVRTLDLGCGSGASTWYLARAGFDVCAVDGSVQAVKHCHERLKRENLRADIQRADFLDLPYPDNTFDLVLEVHSFMCATTAMARQFVQEAYRVLKPGGILLSRTAADDCYGVGLGQYVEKNVWKDSPSGPFCNMGVVRFMSREDVPSLYAPFTVTAIEKSFTTLNNGENPLSFFIVIAKKS